MDIRRRATITPSTEAWADIERVVAIWRQLRGRHGDGGPYLFGRFSIADCMYAPVVTRFVTYGVELDTVARSYCDTMLAHPDLQAWSDAGREEPQLESP